MASHIHEQSGWPRFRWDHSALAAPLASTRHRQGRLIGKMETLGFRPREETAREGVLLESPLLANPRRSARMS